MIGIRKLEDLNDHKMEGTMEGVGVDNDSNQADIEEEFVKCVHPDKVEVEVEEQEGQVEVERADGDHEEGSKGKEEEEEDKQTERRDQDSQGSEKRVEKKRHCKNINMKPTVIKDDFNLRPKTKREQKPSLVGCKICRRKCKSEFFLEAHIRRTHEGKDILCLVVVTSGINGIVFVCSGIKTPFFCSYPNCTKQFGTPAHLRLHSRTHTKEKLAVCDICGGHFARNTSLRTHQQRIHGIGGTREKKYECDQCGKKFWAQASLNVHKYTHSKQYPFICLQCGTVSCYKVSKLSNKLWFTFPGQGYAQKASLERHIVVKHGDNPFKCSLCGKTFCDKNSLKNHEATHDKNKQFTCDICGAGVSTSRALQKHNLRRHVPQSEWKFTCQYCSKKFYSSSMYAIQFWLT